MYILKLAARNLLRHRRRALFTCLSLGAGYVLFSFSIGLSEGSYAKLIEAFTLQNTGHVQIQHESYLDRPTLYKTLPQDKGLLERLSKEKQVKGVSPRIFGNALAYGQKRSFPIELIGVDPTAEEKTSTLSGMVRKGEFLKKSSMILDYESSTAYPAMVGAKAMKALRLNVGDEFVLISQGADGSIANDRFIAVSEIGTEDSISATKVYIPLTAAQEFFALYGRIHAYVIRLNNSRDSLDFAESFGPKLELSNAALRPWQEVEAGFFRAMKMDKDGNIFTLGIVMIIVAIGVLNTILMTILERTHEYGVLRALGTRPSVLFRMILAEATLLGIYSVLGGFLISLPLNYWFAEVGIALPDPIEFEGMMYSHLYGEVSIKSLVEPAIFTVVAAIVVSLWPARRASYQQIVEALRK